MNTISQPVLSRRGTRYSDELYHHGILGQKWGIRKYQNPDGTLTEEGRRRYAKNIERGNTLRALGRTKAGAIGRGIGRQVVSTVASPVLGTAIATGVAATQTNPITKAQYLVNSKNPLLKAEGFKQFNKAMNIVNLGAKGGAYSIPVSYALNTGFNVARTIRDYRDISIAEIAARK